MTGSDPAPGDNDPLLRGIRRARCRKLQAEQDLRTLIAYAARARPPAPLPPHRPGRRRQACPFPAYGSCTARRGIERAAALLRQAAPPDA